MQTNYNEVVLQQGVDVYEKVTGYKKISVKSKHMRDRDMSGKIKTLKRKMEVQEITLNSFCMSP